ncbi:MAG: sugar nucleotide-binding protein [Planctomycetales bacterium]
MDKLLIVGVDTVLGGNLAAWLAQRYQVVGLSSGPALSIVGCETAEFDAQSGDSARAWIASERPQWTVYCGPGSQSTWRLSEPELPRPEAVKGAGAWASAVAQLGGELTVVSSDAVFTGPWMFHREGGDCYCQSSPARILQMIEKEVLAACPNALLVRTNVFGWSPDAESPSFVESVLQAVEEGQTLTLDCMRHATPILATDFAEVLDRAYQQKLRGVYHLGGGERINPFRFACLLADQFGLPMSALSAVETPLEQRRDFGTGETSLQNRRIRKALDVALPMVRDGLTRLHEQHASGYRDRFGALSAEFAEQVA